MKQKKAISINKSIDIRKVRILVTGGSGSLGRNIIKVLLSKGAKNIVSLSRGEKIVKEAEFEIGPSPVHFELGDITNRQIVSRLIQGTDIVFHTAALKYVSLAEQNPRKAHDINIKGLLNLLDQSDSIKRFVFISTDMASGIDSCYRATKLLGEYLVRESNKVYKSNKYFIIRLPYLFGSSGSIVDSWKKQIENNNKIRMYDPDETRLFTTLKSASKYIVEVGFRKNANSETVYYPLKVTHKFRLGDLASSLVKVYGDGDTKVEIINSPSTENRVRNPLDSINPVSKSELIKLIKTSP